MRVIHLLLIFLLVVAGSASASEIIFAVDLSSSAAAMNGEQSALELAIARIKVRAAEAEGPVGLVGYTDKALLEVTPGQFSLAVLDQLVPAEGEASLAVGLEAASDLISDNQAASVVFYTSRGNESLEQLRLQLETLATSRLSVELNLFAQGEYLAPLLISVGEGSRPMVVGDGNRVNSFFAEHLGVPIEALDPDSDLALDFGVGQLEAYELMVQLCEELKIPSPSAHVPTRLGDIVSYVDRYREKKLGRTTGEIAAGGIEFAPALGSQAVKGEDGLYVQTIYYGTNRKATGTKDYEDYFGGARAEVGPVSYGVCEVTIPASHKHGATESPFLGLEMFADPQKHIRIRSIKPMAGDTFFSALHDNVHQQNEVDDWTNDLVVFVHGFNVTFAEGAKRTAQIAFDFGFTGTPVLFSWPSDGKLYGYPSDREDATWSIVHIEKFLQDVRKKAGPKRMHLVAHSMGNQGLIGALNLIALKSDDADDALFESITLAAPDFDAQLFEQQIAPAVVTLAKHWTIYTSDNDAALNISTKVNSAKRLGLPVTPLVGIDVIDATGIEVTPWSVPEFHSYYATKQTVITDIVAAIKGVAPAMRELLPMSKNDIPYWRLKSAKVE